MDDRCVGSCGFKSPSKNNRVEIAYFTIPAHEGKGIATQMARTLVEISTKAAPHVIVRHKRCQSEVHQPRFQKKLGFEIVGTLQHPEESLVWEWHPA